MSSPWLTIVGIGEDGAEGLSPAACEAIAAAAHVFGGKRHLELASPLIEGESHAWPSPFDVSMQSVRERAGTPTCVLASGDPFHFGVGVTLARLIEPAAMRTIPHPSAFSLAASRLGWALQDVTTLSLHGQPIGMLRPHLHDRARLLMLTSDGSSPAGIARLVTGLGMGDSRLVVLEALGGDRETTSEHKARDLAESGRTFDPLNVVALTVEANADAPLIPLTPGLPDDYFDHDGQITKADIRALTLAALAPSRGKRSSTSVPDPVLFRSSGCWPIPVIARSPSRRPGRGRNGSPRMPSDWASPVFNSFTARRRKLLPAWRRRTRSSSAAAPPKRA